MGPRDHTFGKQDTEVHDFLKVVYLEARAVHSNTTHDEHFQVTPGQNKSRDHEMC